MGTVFLILWSLLPHWFGQLHFALTNPKASTSQLFHALHLQLCLSESAKDLLLTADTLTLAAGRTVNQPLLHLRMLGSKVSTNLEIAIYQFSKVVHAREAKLFLFALFPNTTLVCTSLPLEHDTLCTQAGLVLFFTSRY